MEVVVMVTNWAERFGFSKEEAPLGGIPTARGRQQIVDNQQQQEQFDWLKEFQQAGLTGQFRGNDTLANRQFQDQSARGWAGNALGQSQLAHSQNAFNNLSAYQQAQIDQSEEAQALKLIQWAKEISATTGIPFESLLQGTGATPPTTASNKGNTGLGGGGMHMIR
jgi:hypothetical protein